MFGEVQAIKQIPDCSETWVVTESLPFGTDVDPTLIVDLTGDLPDAVGRMLQNETPAMTPNDLPKQNEIPEAVATPKKESKALTWVTIKN